MRAVDVTLGGQVVTVRIPVPSKIFAAFATVRTPDPDAQVLAGMQIFATYAVSEWYWPTEPEAAWEAAWDDGVSVKDVQQAITAWVKACNIALGVEAAEKEAETFPDRHDGDAGDNA